MIKKGSVTTKIKNIKLKEAISENLIPDLKCIKKYNGDIKYPFENIPSYHKCILGTFSDYLIRKMIHDIRDDKVDEKLICEFPIKLETIINSPWVKKMVVSDDELFNKTFINILDNEQLIDANSEKIIYIDNDELNKYKQYIKNYREKSWDELLNDIWEMSLLDSLHRSGEYKHIDCYKELLNKDHRFYKNLFNIANNFNDKTKKIYYNPTLGRSKGDIITKADADIIYDDQLIDWKCTKSIDYKKDLLQCLMYTSLARDKYIKINKCKVYYLLYEIDYELNVEKWDETQFVSKYYI